MKSYEEKVIDLLRFILKTTIDLYGEENQTLYAAKEFAADLIIAEKDEEFVNGMLGFIQEQIKTTDYNKSNCLFTLIHDLNEFSKHRNENWFSPRTSRFVEFYSET